MIIVVASLIAVLSVLITGRSLAPLASVTLHRVWLVWSSVVLQFVITVVPGVPNWVGHPVHLGTYALSAAFLWCNRHLPGSLLLAFGASLNLAAIAANGGTMPASAAAWRSSGLSAASGEFQNSGVTRAARLPWLGDVFAIPKGWPFANVFSVGDVIVVIAIGYFAHVVCRRAQPAADDPSAVASALAATG